MQQIKIHKAFGTMNQKTKQNIYCEPHQGILWKLVILTIFRSTGYLLEKFVANWRVVLFYEMPVKRTYAKHTINIWALISSNPAYTRISKSTIKINYILIKFVFWGGGYSRNPTHFKPLKIRQLRIWFLIFLFKFTSILT